MIGQSEGKTIGCIFHPGDPFVACDARIKHGAGVIETDFERFRSIRSLNHPFMRLSACSFCLCRFQAPSTGKTAEETVVDLTCCFKFLDHQLSTIFTQ
jgi:hypothetical protein